MSGKAYRYKSSFQTGQFFLCDFCWESEDELAERYEPERVCGGFDLFVCGTGRGFGVECAQARVNGRHSVYGVEFRCEGIADCARRFQNLKQDQKKVSSDE